MTDLAGAQEARRQQMLGEEIDVILSYSLSASAVSTEARETLRAVLKHYAVNPHPYRACVVDNIARFGPGRTEQVCGTIKDLIRGTTHWRHQDSGFAGSNAGNVIYNISGEQRAEIFGALTDEDWASLEEVINRD